MKYQVLSSQRELLQFVEEDEKTVIITGDVCSEEILERLREYKPSIIVDDASHIWSEQIHALFGLFDSLAVGGLYILEDIHTSFLPLNAEFHL